jgi:hypothetical protein
MLMQVVFYIKECGTLHTWVTHLHLRHVTFSIHEPFIYIQGEWHSPNVRHSITSKENGTQLHPRRMALNYIQGEWHSFTSKESGTQLHPRRVALIYVQGVWHSPYMSQSFTSKESGSLQTLGTQLHQRSGIPHTWGTHFHARSMTFSIHKALISIQGMWHSPYMGYSFIAFFY